MSRIIPIPTSRVGDLFVRQRLVDQVQLDQLAMFRLQNQVSTGQRLQVPSEDAPAALRAINLQRLLDRKGQIRTNLQSSNSYISAAWERLGSVSTSLSNLRGEVVGAAGNVVSESSRVAVIQQIDSIFQDLISAGNAKFQGRYLFAGSRSQSAPYELDGQFVEYTGNEGVLRNYVDLERLFETNLSGQEVFGGISTGVQGSVDLNPHVAASTLVSTINGGNGIGGNPAVAISFTNGATTDTTTVDLSRAITLGDVARLIEEGAPAGSNVRVEVTGTGLDLSTDSGTISVGEVAEGRTAQLLGIATEEGAPASNLLTGLNLNPALLKTTRLADLLGTKAQVLLESTGANNNDLLVTASANGDDFNNITLEFVDDPAVTVGNEVVTFVGGVGGVLRVAIDEGNSTANDVARAINNHGTFTATVDYHDAASSVVAGTNPVDAITFTTLTAGGGGNTLDTSGLILTNGDETVTVDVSQAETVEELLNLINGAGLGLIAEINAEANGINVRSRLSGADFTIGENGGQTATQLGIRTYTGETQLAALNRGNGVETTSALEILDTDKLDTLRIIARDGTQITVVFDPTTNSLQDVVDAINNDSDNNNRVAASLTPTGNGIELVDSSAVVNPNLRVESLGGDAAEYLGLVLPGETFRTSALTDSDGNYVLAGGNVLGHDLQIVASDGTEIWIDLAETTTVQDVINRINANADAVAAGVSAGLAEVGNGIELVDTGGPGPLIVRALAGSAAAVQLGFVAEGQTETIINAPNADGDFVLQSADRHTLEVDSVFNTLVRLRTAVQNGDVAEMGRALERLDADMDRVNFARAELGARLQNLHSLDLRLEDEDVQLRAALSEDIDVDLVKAISDLTARQFAFEASLRTAGSLMQLSLLNFI